MSGLALEERRPAGVAGGLAWRAPSIGGAPPLAIDDLLVVRPKPFRLVIWEPLRTKAPSPALAAPWCCYIRTVIFYTRPYVVTEWVKPYESRGKLRASKGRRFIEWDEVELRLAWDDLVTFEGETFRVGGGSVLWAPGPGGTFRRWWMRRDARRVSS